MDHSCPYCGKRVRGRSDKVYCSLSCKNAYSYAQRAATRSEVAAVDDILHRNRIILATLMGDARKETIDRLILTRAKFRWEYHTGHYLNKEGKIYWLVYDYAWMEFTDQRILIVRKKIT